MSNISELNRNEVKVGAKLTVVKDRIKQIRDNRAVVMPEVTEILNVLEAMADIFLEAEKSIAVALEKHEKNINLLAKHLGNNSGGIEGDKQIVEE